MNALDAIAIIIIVLFLGMGIYNGLIKSISSLVSILAGLYIAKNLSPVLTQILALIHFPNAKDPLGFLLVFLFFFTAIKIFFHFIEKFSRKSVISKADRVFGGILGLAKGAVITVFIVTVMQIVLPRDAAILEKSHILPAANKVLISARGIVPDDIYRHIQKGKR